MYIQRNEVITSWVLYTYTYIYTYIYMYINTVPFLKATALQCLNYLSTR